MALTETQIKVVIAAELKKAGFDKTSRQISTLERSFKRLGGTILTVFSVRAITQFGRASVRAFADAEREAAQLRTQLKGLNLEFASPLVNQFIDSLSLATGRNGQELTSAFVSLSSATEDVTTAQALLRTALDISSATGKDLQTVSVALQRAYKGEVTALARLRIGFTTAELKGKKFEDILGQLRDRFTGAQAAAADTYAGKLARIGEAAEMAKEKIGEGFVKGLDQSGVSVERVQGQMIELGETVGKVAGTFVALGTSIGTAFDDLENNRGLRYLVNTFDFLVRAGAGIVTGNMPRSFSATMETKQRINEAKRIEALKDQVKAQNNLAKFEKKRSDNENRNLKKAERDRQALKRAGTVFDMENIQIVAAMQNEIDAQERLRLVALLALNTQNAQVAESASKAVLTLNAGALASIGVMMKASDSVDVVISKLLMSQARVALLALGITDLPKAKDPFEDWDEIIKKILADLAAIQAGLQFTTSIDGKKQESPVFKPQNKDETIITHVAPVVVTPEAATNIFSDFPWGTLTEFPTAAPMPTITPELQAAINGSGLDNPWTVNVYVAGSLTTEKDLTKTIIDNIYNYQGYGGAITYNLATI